jgi:putative endonuclease
VSRDAHRTGEFWEEFAAREVAAAGLHILFRRYSCRLGEIDIIALDGRTLVFIEVRYRTRGRYADAAASVTATKQHRIINAARHFLMCHPEFSQYPIRMDVIALEASRNSPNNNPDARWIRAAFDAQ